MPSIQEERARIRGEFITVARYLAAAKGERDVALALAEEQRASESVKYMIRAGVPAQTVAEIYDAADAPYAMSAQAFLASLANVGAADRVFADAVPLPFYQRIGVATGIMSAVLVTEGKPWPMQPAQLDDLGDSLVPIRVGAMTVLTAELAKVASTSVVLERELRTGLASGTDAKWLADMVAETTPIASANLTSDFAALLRAVSLRSNSKPYFIFETAAVKAMATARSASGEKWFEDLDVTGGTIDGVPVIPSDSLASGVALCVDAQQLFVNRGSVGLSISTDGDVLLNSVPTAMDSTTSTGAELVSMWSSGLVGVIAQRTMAYKLARSGAAASLSGVSY